MPRTNDDQSAAPELPRYRVTQYYGEVTGNRPVGDFDDLVTHHPDANNLARIVDGIPINVENSAKRSYGMVGAELQELEMRRTDGGRNSPLGEHQVLLIKDFMLENSLIVAGGAGVRDVDVPAPVAGYIGHISPREGRVDVYDCEGGEVIARIRHMDPIHVQVGDTIEYGQALGTQDNRGLGAPARIHVHMEVDTRYYQQYENYMADLVSGRLAIAPDRRIRGIEPLPVADDGTFRLGEENPRIRDLQRVLMDAGYRNARGGPIETDGIYRLEIQGAVIEFQHAHGLPQTGDIDPATLQLAPPVARREIDRHDHMHRGNLSFPSSVAPAAQPDDIRDGANHLTDFMIQQARAAVHRLDASLGRTPDQASECMIASLACLARENGFRRIDHVLLSGKNEHGRQGENVFIVQGRMDDPAHLRTYMKTDVAVQTPTSESFQRLEQLDRQMVEQHARQTSLQEQQTQQPDAPRRTL